MARQARAEDAGEIADVQVRSWQTGYRGIFPDDHLDSLDVTERATWWERRLERGGGETLVAERSGVIVGFSTLVAADDAGWGELLAIYVTPDHWGVGVGHELLMASVQWLGRQGFDKALLWVAQGNRRARAFYEREGWALGRPIRIENIGGVDVTLVRYEKNPLVGT